MWCEEEGEVKESPMARMRPPKIPENPPDILREEQLKALVSVCEKDISYEGRRDAALVRVFIDTGSSYPFSNASILASAAFE